MAAGARSMGATIQRHTRVTGITRLPSGEFRLDTAKGALTCEQVVNAAGFYARKVGKWLGVDTPITNMEHQYLVTEPLPEFKDTPVQLPVMRDPATAGYYRQEQKAGLVGICEHTGAKAAWECVAADRTSRAKTSFSRAILTASRLGWKRRWTGCRSSPAQASSASSMVPSRTHPTATRWSARYPACRTLGISAGPPSPLPKGRAAANSSRNGSFMATPRSTWRASIWRRFGACADQNYTRAKSFDDNHNMFETPLPGREVQAGRPRRVTPLHGVLRAKGAVMSEVHG